MTLTFTLTDTEYSATQKALTNAVSLLRNFPSQPDELELLHLQTLLAEASINQPLASRCTACDQTAERCTDWGGDCCPVCNHSRKERYDV